MNTEETTLDRMRSRPRFKMYTSLTPEEYSHNLKSYLKKHNKYFVGNINPQTAVITVITEYDNYWKPNLALRTELEEGKTAVRGIFGPSAAVWTFFMFLYFLFGILWMVFITLWFVGEQIKIDDYKWALPVSFVTLGLILLTYAASLWGQKKAKHEMKMLRKFAISFTLPHESEETTPAE